MIRIYPAKLRYAVDHGWLQSNFSFSFDQYYDPANTQFGSLRVFNDDVIQPERGFGMHPHRDMEIVTVVLKGQLQHKDSMGNTSILERGQIQRMTAGTGIVHSEWNPTIDKETHLFQIWFTPNELGLTPSYEDLSYDQKAMKSHWLPVVTPQDNPHTASIHQDLTLYLSELEKGKSLTFKQEPGRKIYLFVMEGELILNGDQPLYTRDAARITETEEIQVESQHGATILLVDLP